MRFFFVGDTHGAQDLDRVRRALPSLQLHKEDAVIQLGDIGVAWRGEEDEALAFWRSLPFKVLVCLGNHENYRWIGNQPVVRKWGALGRDLGGRVFAPLAGETVRIGGRSLWFYPGGCSIDFMFRRPGISIHAEELLPQREAQRALKRLAARRHVDFILSHDGPAAFAREQFGYAIKPPPAGYWQLLGQEENSRAHPALLLDGLQERRGLYTYWYFGHHHRDAAALNGALRCLWNEAVLYDARTGKAETVTLEG